MKTKTFLLLCLFLGIGLNQLSAQKTKTYPYTVPIEGNSYVISIVCNGAEVDKIAYPASYDLKERDHYKNDALKWLKGFVTNVQYISILTNEVFKANDMESIDISTGILVWHMNLNGNMGNHYNIKMVYDIASWTLLEYESNCH
jgi:hypothetical protein